MLTGLRAGSLLADLRAAHMIACNRIAASRLDREIFTTTTAESPMNTTPKKTHIYAVAISHAPNADVAARTFVRAESMAQARNFVAASMLTVDRATTDDILDLKREDVIDATAAPNQQALPLPATTDASDGEQAGFGAEFIDSITKPE